MRTAAVMQKQGKGYRTSVITATTRYDAIIDNFSKSMSQCYGINVLNSGNEWYNQVHAANFT